MDIEPVFQETDQDARQSADQQADQEYRRPRDRRGEVFVVSDQHRGDKPGQQHLA